MLKLVFPKTASDTLARGESASGQGFPPDRAATGEELAAWLAGRVTMTYLRQRLGIETDREAWVFGQGLKPLHIENWYSVHSVIRNSLRLALLLGRARRNARSIQLTHNEVGIAGLPRPFDGLRILHVSDPHVDVDDAFPHVLAERVRDLDYDLCILTGDYRYKTFGPCEPALAGLQRVRAQLKGPVYAVLGNHDSIRMVPAMEAMGIRVLLNEAVSLRRGDALLHLVGVDDPHYYRTDNIEAACRGIDHRAPAILAVHSPEVYRHAAH
ncbi:MAG: metallophosphoesterase, partial [Gammaproteobacteria bacterium]